MWGARLTSSCVRRKSGIAIGLGVDFLARYPHPAGGPVGLGKTLEIGMILSELVRRGRGERILIVWPRHVLEQMQHEMWSGSRCLLSGSTPWASSG